MKPNKYTLLDKSELNGQTLEDNTYESNKNKKQRDAPYTLLEDDVDEKHLNKPQPKTAQKNTNSAKTSQLKQPPPQCKPITYDLSNVKNSVVHIGASGITIQPRAPYIPPVLIDCQKCQAKQQIPGNIPEYICYCCHEKSKIVPHFGIFICGICHNHVCYPYKTSDHIQCNICYTINRVPVQPHDPNSKAEKQEPVLPKDLREEEDIVNDFPDMTTARGEQQQRQHL